MYTNREKLERMTEVVNEAIEFNQAVTFEWVCQHEIIKTTGYVHDYDPYIHQFRLVSTTGQQYRISLQTIVNIEPYNEN